MLVHNEHTDCFVTPQSLSLVGGAWTTEVVPGLPANLAEQARVLKAFQRVRGIATPDALLRGLLAYVLGPLSPRRRGVLAVLIGRADISEAAWRKRLRTSNDWLLWLLGELLATPEAPAPSCPRPRGRLLLGDASCLLQPGGNRGRLAVASSLRLHGWSHASGLRDGPPGWRTRGAVSVARGRGDGGGPGLWLSPQGGHGPTPAGGRSGAAPPSDVPPGNRRRPALSWAALAAATGRRRAGMARLVLLGRTTVCCAIGRRPARAGRGPAGSAADTSQRAKGGTHAHGAPPLAGAKWLLLIPTLAVRVWSAADGL